MPKANRYSCLQVWVDTFTGWIEVFPCCSEQAKEVIKIVIHEIIPRFGLPQRLRSDNGSTFKAAVTQRVSKALGIEYQLYCFWRPQSSGKVEKANDIIKRHLHKLTREMQDNWIKVLPIGLMRAWTAPKKEGLSPFEAALTQGVSKDLGIESHLRCSWRPQSSGSLQMDSLLSEPNISVDLPYLEP